ncbi:MAG: hypothetical protein CFE34_06555 [Rhodobacteraceae bacterium PARR1]|nr:MAG: hypothetical protein CFE34_06555 [Rhodobacteraceae bacterium PARR1]
MPDLATLEPLLHQHGPLLFLMLAVIEGPIATITAAALAQKGVLDIRLVLVLAVLGDLLGDVALHLIGRFGARVLPRRLCRRIGLDDLLLIPMTRTFSRSGWRLLALAKWTHVAGLPTLVASGMARMAFASFLLCSLLVTLPKVAVLCLLGWTFGLAVTDIEVPVWLMLVLAMAGLALLLFHLRRKDRQCA